MQNRGLIDKVSWPGGKTGAFLLAILLAIFFSYRMGNRHFADPDEGRYVEISREMVDSGDFITPRLNGFRYFEKPPLFYWMQAVIQKVLGISETSMRLWVFFFAILGCLGVFFVGTKYYSTAVGLTSSAILATNILYYAHSRLIILDLVLSIFIGGALWCFFLAFVKPLGGFSGSYMMLSGVFAALACLTKGLIGIVLPGIIVFFWMICTKNLKKIKEIFHIPAICVFLIIFLPWHVVMCLRHADFAHFYFVVEHFLRYTSTIHNRCQPFWFFIPILLLGFMPWTGFALVGIKNAFRKAIAVQDSENIFFLCWIFCGLIFFSLSESKLVPYILPILPPLALTTGISLVNSLDTGGKDLKNGIWSSVILLVVVFIAYLFLGKPAVVDVLKNQDAMFLVNVFAGLLVASLAILVFSCKIPPVATLLAYVFVSMNMMWTINEAAVFYQEVKKPSTKRMAETINFNLRKSEDLVYCYGRYYQDFPVYLRSTVGVVDFVGELEFGASSEQHGSRLLTKNEFWQLWTTANKRIFLLLSRERYREIFAAENPAHRVLDFDKNFVVIMNK
ncbi:MAG: phospholipid carrier-dependent glycosyltransferase [Holosporaceae bacterium]|jgi:4-amino-4-deoxy-L-arabinose transferase-like glycosyltransferase|nr:phospholipid carrier-dependent glycosyltransferase [Holosporaceae bacterium]